MPCWEGRDAGCPGIYLFSVLTLLHFQRSAPAENVSHQAAVPRIEMLHHHDSGGKGLGGRAARTWLSALRPPAEAASPTMSKALGKRPDSEE